MPSPLTVDSYSGSSWPQEDNAAPPASGNSLLVTTARLLCTTCSLSTPGETPPVPSPPASSVPTTQNTSINKRWKHYQDN